MGNIFSTINGNMASKPEYTYNFAIITDRNGFPKAKWGNILYTAELEQVVTRHGMRLH